MERLSHNNANKLSFFGEWRVIDESEFMSPTAAAMRAESDYSQVVTDGYDLRLIQKDLHDLQSTLTSPQGQLAGKLQEMNRETTGRFSPSRLMCIVVQSNLIGHVRSLTPLRLYGEKTTSKGT